MRTQILAVFLFAALPGAALAAETKVLAMSGQVELRPTREGAWTAAAADAEVGEGGAVRTGPGGSAVLLMPNKTKVWLKENSNIELEQRQTLASRLALVFGKIKVRVPHLMRKERFEVRTPAAVCAVRGTEFTMGTNEEGQMDLQVLFGEVKLKFMIPPDKGPSEFNIPQGQGLVLSEKGKATRPELLTPKAEREALESWNPGLKASERQAGLREKENDRAQIKEFARATSQAEDTVKSFLNVVKESDLEAGRTLNDVHGNLVRVDQRMVRPSANEIQFMNLVKRPVYSNGNASVAKGGFAYNGAQGVANRLDLMQMNMAFSHDLPQRIEEWPSFFDSNSIDPTWASFVTANRTDASEIFFIAEGYKFDPARNNGEGELVNNPWVLYGSGASPMLASDPDDRQVIVTGVLRDNSEISAAEGLNRIARLGVVVSGADPGTGLLRYEEDGSLYGTKYVGEDPTTAVNVRWAIKTADAAGYSEPDNAPDNAPLAQFQADMYDVGNNGTNFLWYAKENYVIGNGGQVRTAADFTDSSSDPFTLLKENALQSVIYIKQSNSANPAGIDTGVQAKAAISDNDYFAYKHATNGTNIDLVFIPDLMVAAVQRMLPAITNLKD